MPFFFFFFYILPAHVLCCSAPKHTVSHIQLTSPLPGISLQRNNQMYPKVKVRQEKEEQEDPPAPQRIFLKGFQSLSLHDSSSISPAAQHKDDYTPLVVRVPRSHISSSDSKTSAGAEKKVDKKVAEQNKSNTKPSPVLRPRAVLSSPVNDGMVRSKNNTRRSRTDILSGLKTHDSCQDRHVKCKVTPTPMAFGSPINLKREFKEANYNKEKLPETKRLATKNKTSGPS